MPSSRRIERLLDLLETTKEILREALVFPKDVKIVLTRKFEENYKLACYDMRKRKATIRMDLDLRELVKAVAHEMVHAEQGHIGTLRPGPGPFYTWKSEGPLPQWNGAPWELEAYSRQGYLTAYVINHPKFKKFLDLEKFE